MKLLNGVNDFGKAADVWLLLLRLVIGGFMLTHGYPKMMKLLAGSDIVFADPIGLGMTTSLILAVFSEVICSVLIMIGFFTRGAIIPLIITMLVAAFIQHGADPFRKKEFALLYLLSYMSIYVFGPGRYSLDGTMHKKQ